MRNYRFKFTIALGIGAICGMLWTPVKLVHAEQQTSNIIAETEADQEPAAGYVKIEENSSGPELYSDYDIAMYSTDSTTQSGTWGNISWSLSGTTLTISGSGDMPDADSSNKAPWITFNVEKVIIQRGITGIGNRNFLQMSSITSVSYPDTLTKIGDAAFYECYGLTEIVLPSGVNTVGSGAYCDCSAVTKIVTPGATSLESYAFQGTSAVTYEIPAGITSISPLVFFGNTTIESYTVAVGNPSYIAQNGIVYSKDGTVLVMYPFQSRVGTFAILANVKEIGAYAFYNVRGLNSVDFANVTTLGEGAFYRSQLSGTLTISDKISEVGYFAFEQCNMLTAVKFGSGLKESSYSMFEECENISSIDFGGLTTLGMRTFLGCSGLTEITLPATMKEWGGSVFNSCSNLKTFRGLGLESIAYADFAQCYSLTDVYLPNVKIIYRQAFANCPPLQSITLPASTQFVDENAFSSTVIINCENKDLVKFGANGLRYVETIRITGKRDYTKAFEVLTKVNEERAKNGLPALTMDTGLLETAMVRAGDQAVLFSHTRPDGASCFSADKNMIAENIAINQTTSESVMDSWMNSTGHRENILDEDYTSIGVGCFYINGTYTWVQCFGSKVTQEAVKQEDRMVIQSVNIPKGEFTEAVTTAGIMWGDAETYLYKFKIQTDADSYVVGKHTNAKMMLINPGFEIYCPFTSSNITWTSDKKSVATIDSNGKISFVGSGKVKITGKTGYYQASITLTVKENKKSDQSAKTTPVLKLKNKTVTYTGKKKKIDAAVVKGKAGAIAYRYYSDAKCKKKLASYPYKVGTYYVVAVAKATKNSNTARSNVAKLVIKKSNTMKLNVTSKKYKVKKATGKLGSKHTFTVGVKKAKGKVTYSVAKKAKKYITVTKKGRVTVKKGTPRGTYTITVKAKGTSVYRSKTKKVTIKVS